MADLFGYTATDKLACVGRELEMRRDVYGRRVTAGTMKQAAADRELAVMRAIGEDYAAAIAAGQPMIDATLPRWMFGGTALQLRLDTRIAIAGRAQPRLVEILLGMDVAAAERLVREGQEHIAALNAAGRITGQATGCQDGRTIYSTPTTPPAARTA